MAATSSIDLSGWLSEQLTQASPDLLRQLLSTFVEALMGADADAICGAPYGERSEERTNTRNEYRRRVWAPGSARSSWRSRRRAPSPTSRTGCWSSRETSRHTSL